MRTTKLFVALAVCLSLLMATAPAAGASYADLLAKAQAALEYAKQAGKTAVEPKAPERPYSPGAKDLARGLVVFIPPMTGHFEDRVPAADEVRNAVNVTAAPGETECFLLAVHALKKQEGLTWSANAPDGVRVEFLPVVMAPMAQRRSDRYRVVGLWLADGGAVDIPAGHSRAWLVRLRVGERLRPGKYRIAASLAGGRGPVINLRVLPFKLADPWQRKYVFGVFCAGANFNEAQYAQMKAHGLEAILWFWGHYGMKIKNVKGTLRLDFTDLDATITRFQRAGMRGPIVLALGNDCCGHFERAICQAFNLPMQPRVKRRKKVVKLAVLDDPRIEKLMVEALRQLFNHAKAKRWPELVILPYDEPTERLMDEHRRMVRLFRKHFPKVRLYGVTMNRLAWAKMVADTDILVANGDFARIRQFATANNKTTWFYGGATTAYGYADCRWRYGLRTYVYHPDGMWFWCYNFHPGDPWNDFDSHTPDTAWVICWPPLKKGEASVGTLAYEGIREAVDDVRYAMTLEAALEKAGPAAKEIKDAYETWRKGLQGARPKPEEALRYRDQLIQWLLKVTEEKKK